MGRKPKSEAMPIFSDGVNPPQVIAEPVSRRDFFIGLAMHAQISRNGWGTASATLAVAYADQVLEEAGKDGN